MIYQIDTNLRVQIALSRDVVLAMQLLNKNKMLSYAINLRIYLIYLLICVR